MYKVCPTKYKVLILFYGYNMLEENFVTTITVLLRDHEREGIPNSWS